MPTAFVCITTEPASMVEVLKSLKAINGVVEAEMVYGIYDIVVKVKGSSINSLKKIITEDIRAINKITTAITMVVVRA